MLKETNGTNLILCCILVGHFQLGIAAIWFVLHLHPTGILTTPTRTTFPESFIGVKS